MRSSFFTSTSVMATTIIEIRFLRLRVRPHTQVCKIIPFRKFYFQKNENGIGCRMKYMTWLWESIFLFLVGVTITGSYRIRCQGIDWLEIVACRVATCCRGCCRLLLPTTSSLETRHVDGNLKVSPPKFNWQTPSLNLTGNVIRRKIAR